MNTPATCAAETWSGLPCHRVQLPSGDSLRVAEHGAHLLSWVANGRERLYLSPRAVLDGLAPIRGGVPICWPQFNQRGPLPKHGIARQLAWRVQGFQAHADAACLTLALASSPFTQAYWPEAFAVELQLDLRPGQLRQTLRVHNTGDRAWSFSGALHSYLAVDDIGQARLVGLGGQREWDAVADRHAAAAPALGFAGEFDRVYDRASQPMGLHDGPHHLRIEQSASWGNVVVWNPGADKCAALVDMPSDGYRHMLCVEAAQVFAPITVAPAAEWAGWQELTAA